MIVFSSAFVTHLPPITNVAMLDRIRIGCQVTFNRCFEVPFNYIVICFEIVERVIFNLERVAWHYNRELFRLLALGDAEQFCIETKLYNSRRPGVEREFCVLYFVLPIAESAFSGLTN